MPDWTAKAARFIKDAMARKDQAALDIVMINLALEGRPADEVQALAEMVLRQQPHDVQEWWNGECNCDGHQN